MRFRFQWFAAAAAMLPIGVAVAEYAGENGIEQAAPGGEVQKLQTAAEQVARSIANARQQLTRSVELAKKDQDVLLQRCLTDKLQTVHKLEAKAAQPLAELQHAGDEASAQKPFVVVTVIGQKVTRTVQEAAGCVDSKNQPPATIANLAPPSPPEDDFLPGSDGDFGSDLPAVDDFDSLPPPAVIGTETDFDPSTDLPPEMMGPPVASPTK